MTKIRSNPQSLYIHIPFCKTFCKYCDFCKYFYDEKISNLYINQLLIDLDKYKNYKFKTIYIGGGTPTSLNLYNLNRLLKVLTKLRKNGCEFTIESTISDIDEVKLSLLKKYRVNRISLGVQSFDNHNLTIMGIRHKEEDIYNKIKLVKKYFKNINLDLMYGMPFSKEKILKSDLNKLVKLNPTHISIYSLIIEENTKFYLMNLKTINDDELRKQYDYIVKFLNKNGYKHYEISNFSKYNKYSRHNLTYWKNNEYIGLGLGASSYVNKQRFKMTPNMIKYLKGERIFEVENLYNKDIFEYYVMLGLRTKYGIDLNYIKKNYGINLIKNNSFKELLKNNIIIKKGHKITVSPDYFYVQDEVVIKLLNN